MIQPNASRDELNSPYYYKNEAICQKWEEFALKNGGEANGTFNSWSFKLFLKNDQLPSWRMIVSRATYTSGMLILSSKYQSLMDLIKVELILESNANFTIRKRSIRGLFSSRKRSTLGVNQSYIVLGSKNSEAFTEIVRILTPIFKKKRVRKINLSDKVLVISLVASNEEYEIVQSLIHFQQK